jgi:hypothetical protein
MRGFIVTWDVISRDRSLCGRVRRFVFGYELSRGEKTYRYPGLIHRDGVRYLGQSVVFVSHARLPELRTFLRRQGVPFVVTAAGLLGSSVPG